MSNPCFKRTLISSAVAMACYGGAANAACPGIVSGAEGVCNLPGGSSVTVTDTGSLDQLNVANPGAGNVDNAGTIGNNTGTTRAVDYAGDLDGSFSNSGNVQSGAAVGSTAVTAMYLGGNLNGSISNTGQITSTLDGGGTESTGWAFGLYIDGDISGGASLINEGQIEATAKNLTGWATTNAGIYVSGEMDGTLNNSGTIMGQATNAPGGTAYGIYIGGGVGATGTITNSGKINGLVDGTTSGGTVYGVYIENSLAGTLDNSGQIKAQYISPLDSSWGGGYAYGVAVDEDLSGTLNNSGTIEGVGTGQTWGTGFGVAIQGNLSGTLENTGTIAARINNDANPSSGASAYAYGIYIGADLSGNLLNSGSVTAEATTRDSGDSSAYAYGVYVNGYLDGTLNNTGDIIATADAQGATTDWASAYALGLYVDDGINGTLDNSGTIKATATARVNNSTDDGAYAEVYGVYVDDDDLTGTFTNSGLIEASGSVSGKAFDDENYGTAYGIYLHGIDGGSLLNSGTVRSSMVASGSHLSSATTGFDLGAVVYGIYVDGSLGSSLINSGAVEAYGSAIFDADTAAADWAGASVMAIDVNGDLNGILTNSGSVSATAVAGDPANGASSLDAFAYGIYIDGNVNAVLTNSGSIEVSASVSGGSAAASRSVYAYGLYIDGDVNATINNSGTISALGSGATTNTVFAVFVRGDSSGGVFTNSGTIIGDVQLNGGILNLNGGSIDGAITSVNALDVNVGGEHKSSEIDIAGANVDDFAIVNGGNWILDAPIQDVTTFTVNGTGRLTFAKSAVGLAEDITGTGTVAVNTAVDATLTGNYTQGAGGTFEVQTSSPDKIGRLNVTGTADLSASNQVHVDVLGLLEVDAPIDDILTAATLTAGPLTTSDNSLFYTLTASVDGNTIDLSVDRDLLIIDAVEQADLPYARGIANALDQLLTNGGTGQGIDGIMVALGNLPGAEEVAEAVAQMVPVGAGEATSVAQNAANQFSNVVGNRITGQRGLSAGDGGMYEEGHMWVKPFGGFAEQDRRSGVPGYDSNTVGIGFGGDVTNGRLLLGAGFAWSDTEVDSNTISRNELDVESYQLVFYGNYDLDETSFVEGYAMVGWNENDSLRDINFGTFSATAKGDFDSIFTPCLHGCRPRL